MPLKLTWDDLLIQNLTADRASAWLQHWDWLITGKVAPIFLTKFGNWYLRRPDNSVELLDVLEGSVAPAAPSLDDFYPMVNQQTWQEENLLSLMIYNLHLERKVPGPDECYGFAPHPRFTGKIERDQVVILTVNAWQSICAQTCR